MGAMISYFGGLGRGAVTIARAMGVGVRAIFEPKVTLQYPDEKADLPPRTRMLLYNEIDDCIGCAICERACPVDCITVKTIKATDDVDLGKTTSGNAKRLHVPVFDIDMAKCCYCGLCTFPCPTECLTMTNVYERAVHDRSDLIYHFATMTPEDVETAERKLKEETVRKAAEKKAKAAEAAQKKAEEAAQAAAEEAAKPADPKPEAGDAPAPDAPTE